MSCRVSLKASLQRGDGGLEDLWPSREVWDSSNGTRIHFQRIKLFNVKQPLNFRIRAVLRAPLFVTRVARNKDNQHLLGLFYSANAEPNDGSQSNKSCAPNTGSKVKWLFTQIAANTSPGWKTTPIYTNWKPEVGEKAAPLLGNISTRNKQHDWGTFGGPITWKAESLLPFWERWRDPELMFHMVLFLFSQPSCL